jgi:outer membrane protein OmpA-like peptidoglycan-associated protein
VINTATVDKNGKYKVKLPAGAAYDAEISAPEYLTKLQSVDLTNKTKAVKEDVSLKQTPKTTSLSGQITNKANNKPLKSTIVVKSGGKVIKTITTDPNGNYNLDLPKGSIYDVEVSAPGYATTSKTIDLTSDNNAPKTDFALVPLKQSVKVEGIVSDSKTKTPIKSQLTVKSNGTVVKTIDSNPDGLFNLDLPKGKVYEVEASASGYAPKAQTIDLTTNDNDLKKDFSLTPEIQGVQLQAKVVDSKTAAPVEATLVVKNNDKVVKSVKADKTGTIKVDVPEGKSYEIEVAAPGYVPQRQIIDLTNVPRGVKKEITLDPIVKIEKGLVFKFKNVNFNTGTADLTPEALIVLNMVSNILNENPKLQIEISGHTDNVGKPAANMDLSNRRANAVMNYLISKGAKPEQMKAFGFGQTKWIATNKTVAGKAENRRVEFKVVSL